MAVSVPAAPAPTTAIVRDRPKCLCSAICMVRAASSPLLDSVRYKVYRVCGEHRVASSGARSTEATDEEARGASPASWTQWRGNLHGAGRDGPPAPGRARTGATGHRRPAGEPGVAGEHAHPRVDDDVGPEQPDRGSDREARQGARRVQGGQGEGEAGEGQAAEPAVEAGVPGRVVREA